ncbi:sugar-binding domain-containing protein [Paenibacillus sp. GD4]|jgi:deoxyribonucleoside regulator|uniref:sugar-binding transcriptional regulator n=1 Tax=Paenibacillus sp. GD4 TaxID=3068890 RepID=UPI0027969B51|nr:sugar-binding domain-containing protein [Paenibacillus sp. GD4]MDQ1911843.1 sugar-binding domain-containing protein [Paenibacillus sp. GD4]
MSKLANNEQLSKDSFLERIARMYYVLNMNQQEISEQLGIGRSSVARFLNEARERGIVQFHIRSDIESARASALERQLVKMYGLKDCVVFRNEEAAGSFEALTSRYLNSVLPTQGAIGLGWGRTLYSIGTQMQQCDARPGLRIVQLSGGSGAKEDLVPAASVIQVWAQSLRGKPLLFPAPAVALTQESKNGFLADPSIQEMMKEIREVSAAVVGIGHVGEDSTIIRSALVPGLDSKILSESGVGDVIFHFYNEEGQFSNQQLSDRVVGASPEDYLRIELRIGVAYGSGKIKAIQGALTGRLIHVLITDEDTAASILGEGREKPQAAT